MKKGSILIFTLWVLVILSILSVIVSRRASSDVKLAKYESDSIKATYLCRAGVMKMLSEIVKDKNSYDSLNEDWNRDKDNPKEFSIRNDTVYYGASDESARLNLNTSTQDQLITLGVEDIVAKKIIEYRKNKKNKDKTFEFMEELFLVEGMTKEIYLQIKDYVTIYRGTDTKININTAPEPVLLAIVGDVGLVGNVIDYRKGPDFEEGTEDDGIFNNSAEISNIIQGLNPALFSVNSDIFRIWAESYFTEDRKLVKGVKAVLDRSGTTHHWKEY